MEKKFVRAHAAFDIAISLVLIISGITLLSLPTSQSVNVLGFFLLATGIILICIYKSGYKEEQSGEIYTKKEHFFPQTERGKILEAVSNYKLKNIDFSTEDKGNGIRLDVYQNKNKSKAFVQVFEYIPYKYEACTEQYEYTANQL